MYLWLILLLERGCKYTTKIGFKVTVFCDTHYSTLHNSKKLVAT